MTKTYVYAPGGTLDTRGSAAEVALRLAVLDIVSLSNTELEAVVTAVPGTHETHPVRFVGAALNDRQQQTGEVDDGVQEDDYWQVTRVFTTVPLGETEVVTQNAAEAARVQASRTRTEDAAIIAAVEAVSDADTKAALRLIITRMGVAT